MYAGGYIVIIKTILNNNAVIVLDENKREVVVVKNGIGFNSKKGDILKKEDMEKMFVLQEEGVSKHSIELLSTINDDIICVSKRIVAYGRETLKQPIHDSIFITLSDHINLAIARNAQGRTINNPLDWDIKKIYRQEHSVGMASLEIIKDMLGITLPSEEAGFIALHFVNAEINDDKESMHNVANMMIFIHKVLNFVKYYFSIEYDEDSMDYYRFVRHLQFSAQRIFVKNNGFSENRVDMEMMDFMSRKYVKEFACTEKIRELIKREYYIEISREEQFYLLIHINRLISL